MVVPIICWLSAFIIFIVLEAVTIQFVSMWFCFGTLAGLITTLFAGPVWLQIVMFVAVSALALLISRPLVKKWVLADAHPTNSDMLIGKVFNVMESIDNDRGTGSVVACGKIWSARSLNGDVIPAGTSIIPVRIEGVKLILKTTQK